MRECVWENRFSAELKKIEPDQKRADDLIAGIDWVLARNPQCGVAMDGAEVWYIVSRDIPKHHHLVIFYTFNVQTVFFLSVISTSIDELA